jgi:hypothetical protein
MRVDYTLPALQPETLEEAPIAGETSASFHDHLRGATLPMPISWEQQLRLDVRPFNGSYIGPPPRPHTLEVNDPETERSRWRNVVSRHCRTLTGNSGTSNAQRCVQTMLEMLLEMQQMEDSIVSQNASVTRG